jgi:hypothetical protein
MFNVTGSDVFLIAVVMVFVSYLIEKFKPSDTNMATDNLIRDLRGEVLDRTIEAAEYKGKYWEIKHLFDEQRKKQ